MHRLLQTRWLAILAVVLLAATLALGGDGHDHSTHRHPEQEGSGGGGDQMVDHGAMAAVQAAPGMRVDLRVEPDAAGGVNITILPDGFAFAPQSVNGPHVPGEGHAHLYVDGAKVTRLYGPRYHLAGLGPGDYEIRVALNAHTHAEYAHGGRPVDVVRAVTISGDAPAHDPGMHHVPIESPGGLTVALHAEADALGGAVNIRIDTGGFTFTPQHVNGEHVPGEGHAHVYVDGEKVGRVYGPHFFLGGLDSGEREIRVTLNANTHAPYQLAGEPVAAAATVTVP